MTNTITEFKITQKRSNGSCITKIENNTMHDCITQSVPNSPKRKRNDYILVKNNSWFMIDKQDLDISKIGIIFKNV